MRRAYRNNLKDPNVLLISIDGLRPDRLHCYGNPKTTSPAIDGLASGGIVFKNAFSHGGGSPEALPSMHAAVLPPTSSDQFGELLDYGTTISEVLKAKGYSTGAFVDSNAFLSKYFHFDKGYDYFYDGLSEDGKENSKVPSVLSESRLAKKMDEFALLRGKRPVTTAEQLNKKVISWLSSQNGKFFAWIHYMDTHQPLLPSWGAQAQVGDRPMTYYGMLFLQRKARNGINRMNDKELQKFINLYDALVRSVDNAIANLLAELKKQDKLKNTLIVITADHGTNLGEKGLTRHGSVYERVIRIPLIICGPGITQSSFDIPVTSMGIRDVITNLVNGASQSEAFTFAPLRASIDSLGGVVSTMVDIIHDTRMVSYRNDRWKYIKTEDLRQGTAKSELYDLESDPAEKIDVKAGHPEESSVFEVRVQDFIRTSALRFANTSQRAILF